VGGTVTQEHGPTAKDNSSATLHPFTKHEVSVLCGLAEIGVDFFF